MKRLLFLCLAITSPALAAAGIPSPSQSSLGCFVVCPAGDFPWEIFIRDEAGEPVANSLVELLFCDGGPAPDISFCAEPPPCVVSKVADADGRVVFHLQAGGGTYERPVRVVADGVTLGTKAIASPDWNKDRVVNGTDWSLLATHTGCQCYTVVLDLNCDSDFLNQEDLWILEDHLTHECPDIVSTKSRTWGQIKVLYR